VSIGEKSNVAEAAKQEEDKNRKGCDIGYGLAASFCEEANSVDPCTVTALDVIAAFAVPNPNGLLAEAVGFFGSECSTNHFVERITQSTSGLFLFPESNPFDRRRMQS
jgi:hypothetical protein